jgi:vacuolar-type H+-ATPase subunit E/Vma4
MPFSGVEKAVIEKAKKEAAEIAARAKKEAQAAVTSAAQRAEKEAAETTAKARSDAEEETRRAMSGLEHEMRLKGLEEKNRLLEEVIQKAAEQFKRLKPEKLAGIYGKELETTDVSGAMLMVAPGTKDLFRAFAAKGVKVAEDSAIEAGYVLVRDDFRLDRTLKTRLDEIRAEMRTELARILFED